MNTAPPNTREDTLAQFDPPQRDIVTNAAALAEELVANHFKLSANQWLNRRYDLKTLADLSPEEIVHGPFAQIIHYRGHRGDPPLGSKTVDLYNICLQDHRILSVLEGSIDISLFPFILYIVTHELIHIVRFTRFLQNFVASEEEKLAEEQRVHRITHDILKEMPVPGLESVLDYYRFWRKPFDEIEHDAIYLDKS